MNYLKINVKIGIDYLFNGNASSPDLQVINKSSNNTMKHNHSSHSVNNRINNATNINGPHRAQSVDQNSILQQYDKMKLSGSGGKKGSLSQSSGKCIILL